MIASHTVYYTDDDSVDQEIFIEILSGINRNIKIQTQNSGEELLQLLINRTNKPDVIFLDLNMPELDGFETIKYIRNHADHKETPIIIFSTSDDEDAIGKSKNLGATHYIEKPRCINNFKSVMNKAYAMKWQHKESNKNFVINAG